MTMPHIRISRRTALGVPAALAASAALSKATSHFTGTAGKRLHWVEAGEGPPIVFLHGWQLDHRIELADFEPVFESGSNWRRIYVDLPGAGLSDIGSVRNQDDILEVILAFIDEVVGTGPFSLVGTSAGGYLARGVVAERRSRIDGLLLRVPMVVPAHAKRRLPAKDEGSLLGASDRRDHELKDQQLYLPAVAKADPMLSQIEADPKRYGFSFDLDARSALRAPGLIITGRKDQTVGYADTLPLLSLYPEATFALIAEADHSTPVGDRPLFDALVRNWLMRVRTRISTL
jgi:pimeloyl-ACP methyl ester carboxylesterase